MRNVYDVHIPSLPDKVNAVNIGLFPVPLDPPRRELVCVLALWSLDAVQQEIRDLGKRTVGQQGGQSVDRRPGRYLGTWPPCWVKHAILDELVEHPAEQRVRAAGRHPLGCIRQRFVRAAECGPEQAWIGEREPD